MEEWKSYRLGDIVRIGSGLAYKADYLGTGDSLLLGMGCVSFTEKFLHKGARPYSGECEERYCVSPGDIVLATRQQSDNLPILGMPAIIPNAFQGKRLIAGSNLYIVHNHSDIDNRYLYWLLKTPQYINHISSCKTGTTVRMITKKDVESFEFKCPNKTERENITNFLWSIEDKIEINNHINHNLEKQAQALYKSWFVDFEPFKNSKFINSELGMIPEEWRVVSLDSLTSIVSRGFSPKYSDSSDDIVLGQRCVRNNMIDLSVSRTHIPRLLGERELRQHDILINSTGMGSLGRVAQIYFVPSRMTFDSHLTLVRAKDDNLAMYLGRNLLNRQDEIENMAVGSTGQTELPRLRVKSMTILLPPEDVLQSFSIVLRSYTDIIQSNIEETNKLAKHRDILLPKLMNGEVKLNEICC